MAKQDFKFIKGKCCSGCPSDIYFYTDVDWWSVQDFLSEFDYLVNYVAPSKIRIHINSAGGSVVEGMSVFSKIIDCTIPTECINDALAASMGSVIWAAGDEMYMKDYALLMIHNPFTETGNDSQVIDAFTEQIKTIYMKRFNLSEEAVKDIMDGKEGEDGTFMTAQQAIEKGFLSADHIIETPKAIRDSVNEAIKGVVDMAQIKAVFKLMDSANTGQPKKHIINSKSNKMEDNNITVFAALVGLTGGNSTVEKVTAKIEEMKAKAEKLEPLQKTLDDTKAELTKVQNDLTKAEAELTGANTTITNLTEDLNQAKALVKTYQDAEEKAKNERVEALIDQAIADCKINKDERELYVKMAQNDFAMAENVLAKIPARDNIGNIIAKTNQEDVQANIKTATEQVEAKVSEVVGKDFQFRSLL